MKQILLSICILIAFASNAQFVTHGPVVSGVTPNAARVYVRTTQASKVEIQLSTDANFTSHVSVIDSTKDWRDSSNIINVANLNAYTTYYYRVLVNDVLDTVRGYFKTFPMEGTKGNYTWSVLSCQEFGTYNTFNALYERQPELVLHTGDWSYPDYQIPGDHRTDWGLQQLSWRKKYNEQKMPKCIRSAVFDYVPDNHDGSGQRDNINYVSNYVDTNGMVHNVVTVEAVPPLAVQNVFKGYYEYFPGYHAADSTIGMYHSYRYGNAEVFFVDGRHCGNGQDSTFRFDSINNYWVFDPKPGQTLLGNPQMQWLKNGLENSTADWKFIVSGVMFNRNFRKVIQVSLTLQSLLFSLGGTSGTGFTLAHGISSNWCAYPAEQDGLLNFISQNNIKDVIVLSGHVHTNVMDNGQNAGLPELNTGPAAGYGAELTYYIDSVMQLLGQGTAIDSLWNGGGQGVNNQNFKSGFGMVEIFGSDSVVMQIVDEDNLPVSSMTIKHSSIQPTDIDVIPTTACVVDKVYPNVANSTVHINFCNNYTPKQTDRSYLIDLNGRVQSVPVKGNSFSVSELAAGHYVFVYDYGPEVKTFPIQVVK